MYQRSSQGKFFYKRKLMCSREEESKKQKSAVHNSGYVCVEGRAGGRKAGGRGGKMELGVGAIDGKGTEIRRRGG